MVGASKFLCNHFKDSMNFVVHFGLQVLKKVVLHVDLITVASKLVGKILGYQCIRGVFPFACNILNRRVRHPQRFHYPAQKSCKLTQVKH